MKQRCELLKLKAFLAFVSSQQYAQMYANHTLKDFSLYRKSFAANSLIKPNSIRQMKQKNRSEYCELFLRNLFFSFIFIDVVPPIRKRFAMKHFAATKFFFLSVFSFAVGVVIVVRHQRNSNTEIQTNIKFTWNGHMFYVFCRFLVHSLNIKITGIEI